MHVPFVDLKAQYASIKNEIDSAINGVISETAFIGGKRLKQFETDFAAYCTAKHCVGVGNGTDAITIALFGLGIGKGDEVITAANSFIASSEAITAAGARVVFADVDPVTYTIDPKAVEKLITPRTRAILPVQLYGQPADMDALQALARAHNLKIIEDAAQAHGAEFNGRRVGTLGDACSFSFYPGKNLGAYGDGGAIVTNNDELATRMRMYANHGRIGKYDHEFEGINSRLDGLQAAILGAKLPHLEKWTEGRRRAAARYNANLKGQNLVVAPVEREGSRHVYHLYVVRLEERERIQAAMKEDGIETGVHYPVALHTLGAYKYLGHKLEDFPVSYGYSQRILSLPMYPEISDAQIDYVCERLLKHATRPAKVSA
jgi:dTDP-4-amino-4,6-dideoxygalactose transaminase